MYLYAVPHPTSSQGMSGAISQVWPRNLDALRSGYFSLSLVSVCLEHASGFDVTNSIRQPIIGQLQVLRLGRAAVRHWLVYVKLRVMVVQKNRERYCIIWTFSHSPYFSSLFSSVVVFHFLVSLCIIITTWQSFRCRFGVTEPVMSGLGWIVADLDSDQWCYKTVGNIFKIPHAGESRDDDFIPLECRKCDGSIFINNKKTCVMLIA